jgi:acetyl esterase
MEASYEELLRVLQHKTHTETNRYGQRILVKEIPDADTPGEFDPRVLRMHLAAEEPVFAPGYGDCLTAMRGRMGWPNRDVTGGRTDTRRAEIPAADGWRIPVEIYTPRAPASAPRPCIVFFHGGAFYGGTVRCVANDCRCLADLAGAAVVSVDYRLSPEYPFPYGFHDCCDVVDWLYENPAAFGIDRARIAVAGDSAGGNLAAAAALRDRDRGTRHICFQALIYPVLNLYGEPHPAYVWREEDYTIRGEHADLVRAAVRALGTDFGSQMAVLYTYGSRETGRSPYASPLFAKDLAGCAPALILSAEFDYLRLEGEAYGRLLEKAGCPVRMLRYQGMDHAFLDKTGDCPQCEDALREIAAAFGAISGASVDLCGQTE